MINWLTNIALDQHLQRSNSKLKREDATKEIIIMYPQHLAFRMQISSTMMFFNVITCLYYGFMDCFFIDLLVMLCSLNHWRFPIIGIRRSIDLLMAQIATFYHIYIAYYTVTQYQWNVYVYVGFIGVLIFYSGAIFFGVQSNKNGASACHFMMHTWGIIANTYLYISVNESYLINNGNWQW
eukprot:62130_1